MGIVRWRWWLGALLGLLFPARCAACGLRCAGGPFCGGCLGTLEPVPGWRCPSCAECGAAQASPARRGQPCARCVARPPPFTRIHVAFAHGGALARAIARLKYRGQEALARPLGELLVPAGIVAGPGIDALVPVPSTARRRRRRGGDPVRVLAKIAAGRLGLPVRARWLARRIDEGASAGRSREGRVLADGTFVATEQVRGLRIALVDDVVTTTATVRAAAEALRRAGAREVIVLALARAAD